jgi:LPXTG-motif cell wall-anchored protein
VKRATLSRRLLAGAAGLAIGLGGILAVAAPAQATGQSFSDVKFEDNCDGTFVTLKSGSVLEEYEWTIEQQYGDFLLNVELKKGEKKTVFVPKDVGEFQVDFKYSPRDWPPKWPRKHVWKEPRICKIVQDPTVTQPTCEDPIGEIMIPEAPENVDNPLQYRLDGVDVDRGSTHEVGPGTYVVTAHLVDPYDPYKDKLIKTWTIEIVEPDCPEETPPPDDGGGGGELPKTGVQTVLLGAGALLLLALGGGLYVVTRRRRITFTA